MAPTPAGPTGSDHLTIYRSSQQIPLLVRRAMARAAQQEFDRSCLPEVGRLLQVLSQQVTEGTIGEIGAGCGVGTTWLTCGVQPGVPLITVERDPRRASAVDHLVTGVPAARVITGDWREIH